MLQAIEALIFLAVIIPFALYLANVVWGWRFGLLPPVGKGKEVKCRCWSCGNHTQQECGGPIKLGDSRWDYQLLWIAHFVGPHCPNCDYIRYRNKKRKEREKAYHQKYRASRIK